jgi:parallel beta-helix repeat protein
MRIHGLLLGWIASWVLLMASPLWAGPALAGSLEIHVSPDGRDAWPGTAAQPVATLDRARDIIRALKTGKGLPPGGVRVLLAAGHYHLSRSFDLGPLDSGTAQSPIVYAAAPGAEVELSGGKALQDFKAVTDPAVLARLAPEARGHVLVTDLAAQGIESGRLTRRGFGLPLVPSGIELYFRNQAMPLARWPNADFAVMTAGNGTPGGQTFTVVDGGRMTRWAQEDDLWAYGYWGWDWADSYESVAAVDPIHHAMTLRPPGPVYGLKAGQRFYLFNALCELDSPGEWYVDRKQARLYFWPPAPISPGAVGVAVLETLIHLRNAGFIRFERLGLSGTRGSAVVIEGADHDVLSQCVIRECGNLAVVLKGRDSGVTGCRIWDTGDGGLALDGGDRQQLAPGGLYADGNTIHDYNRWGRTYRPGIQLDGVGLRAQRNLIYNGPHNAILFRGNDHLIEGNEIHHVCQASQDVGAIYTGRDWTARGTVIRYNYLHNIRGMGNFGAQGVYLDDQTSGIQVIGNIFDEVRYAIFVGGGRDNTIQGNLFVNCPTSVHLDARGLEEQKRDVENPSSGLRQALSKVPYRQGSYLKYPGLASVLEDAPGAPKGNRIIGNIVVGGAGYDVKPTAKPFVEFARNLTDSGALFRWPERLRPGAPHPVLDFELKPGGPAASIEFQPIPLNRIGPGNGSNQ